MSLSFILQFLIIITLLWNVIISMTNKVNNFSIWKDKTKIVQIDNNIKPVEIKNIYNITLKVKNFKDFQLNGIKFDLKTLENNKYIITNIRNNNWNYFFKDNNWDNDTYILSYDKYNGDDKWNINLSYIINSDSNETKKILIDNIENSNINNLIINIQAEKPFDIIIYNYKYKLKKNARWNIKYNTNHVIINSNFFINKIN